MSRARLRYRLAPQIAAALILTSLAACAHKDGKGKDDEQAVTMDQLPAPVAATLNRESAGGTVTELEKELKHGKVVYSADVEMGGHTWDIVIAEDGTLMSKKLEKKK